MSATMSEIQIKKPLKNQGLILFWRWMQSCANLSTHPIPCNREKYSELTEFVLLLVDVTRDKPAPVLTFPTILSNWQNYRTGND
ncbi:hypothetical protein SAMN04515620_11415 [Collimonas sp. OK607]|nr:hypothetical protein SAMN04515620_11415 [Collimonas sp. OK607]